MNVKAGILFLNLLFIVNLFSTVWAGEAMVKIANVSDRVMDKYIKRGGIFFTERSGFYDGLLEQALYYGVKAGAVRPEDMGSIHRDSVLEKDLREARQEIKKLFPFMGSLVGRQEPAGSSGWNKFIVNFKNKDGKGDYIVEVGGRDPLGTEEISHFAVKNKEGKLKNWRISDKSPGKGEGKTVYRMSQTYFMQQLRQKDAFYWLRSVMPESDGVGLMIIRRNYELGLGDNSDMVLVWIHLESLPQRQKGLPEASIVLGWKQR
jgi:hypothetical protein